MSAQGDRAEELAWEFVPEHAAKIMVDTRGGDRRVSSADEWREHIATALRAYAEETRKEDDPWEGFLMARTRCIAWMAGAGRSDEYIASALSMADVVQVTLIRKMAEEDAAKSLGREEGGRTG